MLHQPLAAAVGAGRDPILRVRVKRSAHRNSCCWRPRGLQQLVMAALALAALVWMALLGSMRMAAHLGYMDSAALLPPIDLAYTGPVASEYGVVDGYWALTTNHSFPPAASLLQRARFSLHSDNRSCWDIAAASPEPYTQEYRPKHRPPQVHVDALCTALVYVDMAWWLMCKRLLACMAAVTLRTAWCSKPTPLPRCATLPHKPRLTHPPARPRRTCRAACRVRCGSGWAASAAPSMRRCPFTCATGLAATTAPLCCAISCWPGGCTRTWRAGGVRVVHGGAAASCCTAEAVHCCCSGASSRSSISSSSSSQLSMALEASQPLLAHALACDPEADAYNTFSLPPSPHTPRRRSLEGQEELASMIEEALLAALHLFELPDADLLIHLGGCEHAGVFGEALRGDAQ